MVSYTSVKGWQLPTCCGSPCTCLINTVLCWKTRSSHISVGWDDDRALNMQSGLARYFHSCSKNTQRTTGWDRPRLACSEGHSAFQPPASPSTVFFRQTQGESLSIPGPSLLPPHSSILLILLLFFFSFLSSISWIMIQISIQDKNVFYFTLSAVIKFCPQQGHCCFHGNQYTLKLRRMTV